MEQRIQKRVSKQLLAKVSSVMGSFFCYVQDMTRNGLGLSCNQPLEVESELAIDLNVPQYPTMKLVGSVVWRRDLPVIAKQKFQLGVQIAEPPHDYVTYVEKQLRREYERREHPRYSDCLEVYTEDVLDLLEAATGDVAAEGLYVRTNRLLKVGQQLDMKLCGKELAPILCLGEVVASFTCDSDSLDHPFGAGVRILSYSSGDEKRFAEYLKYLKALYEFHWPDKADEQNDYRNP